MFMKTDEASSDVYEIKMNEVITNDNYIYGKSVNNTFASIAMTRQDKMSFLPRFANIVIFLTSHSLQTTSRTVYSFTDWMNEVGGFQAWIYLFISFVLPLC
jgi:hypothetical protein